MTQPKISIITPSYNQGEFIESTINSVLNQNYPNLEYWVIDGGSQDQTLQILKKYQKYLNFLSEPDQGQVDAINKGLNRVTGNIIAYINSDDCYLPHTFELIRKSYCTHPDNHWWIGSYEIINAKNKVIQNQKLVVSYKEFMLRRYSRSLLIATNSIIPQPSSFWSRDAYQKIGQFNPQYRYAFDYDYWIRLSKFYKPVYIPNKLSQFRLHASSKSQNNFIDQMWEETRVLQDNHINSISVNLHYLHTIATLTAYHLLRKT